MIYQYFQLILFLLTNFKDMNHTKSAEQRIKEEDKRISEYVERPASQEK